VPDLDKPRNPLRGHSNLAFLSLIEEGKQRGQSPMKFQATIRVVRQWWTGMIVARGEVKARRRESSVVEGGSEFHVEQLRKSEALLAKAEQMGQLGCWEHNFVTGESIWSANLCRMLGVDPTTTKLSEELFWKLLHPDDREAVQTVINGAMKFAHEYEYQSRFILPGGQVRTFHTLGKPVLGPDSKVVKRMGVTQDISLRVESERALLESEERYRDLVENSHDLICTHDLNGRVLWTNELPAKLLGYRREELIGFSLPDHLPPGATALFWEYIERIKRDGFANGLMVLMTKSGERRIWEYQNTLRTEGVAEAFVRGMAHDVTERVKSQRALRESAARLQALSGLLLKAQDEERRRVASEVHDGIGSYVGSLSLALAKIRTYLDETNHQHAEVIAECSELIQGVGTEIRTISYLLHPPTLDLLGLESALTWLVSGFSHASGIKTSSKIAPNLGRFNPEVELTLFRVTQEALNNVYRHSESKTATVELFRDSRNVVLEIADWGKGMKPDFLEPTRPFTVGISEMRERVENLRGTFSIESAPGKGCVVRASAPLEHRQ
jgi:PAS domain S-box-containing protein